MYEREIAACIDRCLKMEEERPRKSSVWFEKFKERHNISSLLELSAGGPSMGMEEDRKRMKAILRTYDREVKKRLVKERENGNTTVLRRLKNLRFMKYRSMDNE